MWDFANNKNSKFQSISGENGEIKYCWISTKDVSTKLKSRHAPQQKLTSKFLL